MDKHIIKIEDPASIVESIMLEVTGEIVQHYIHNELANDYDVWLNIDSIEAGKVDYHIRSGSDCPMNIKFKGDYLWNAQEYIPLYVKFAISDGVKEALADNPVDPDKVWYQLHVAPSIGAINDREINLNIQMYHHFNG